MRRGPRAEKRLADVVGNAVLGTGPFLRQCDVSSTDVYGKRNCWETFVAPELGCELMKQLAKIRFGNVSGVKRDGQHVRGGLPGMAARP
jgi:hypothetical protein